MSDIWSGIPVDLNKNEGEYLYRVGSEVRGPVPRKVIADKLLRGELPLTTEVAVEGGEFNPVTLVAGLAETVKQAQALAAKRAASRTRRIVGLVLLVVAGAGGGGAFFVWQGRQDNEAKKADLEKQLEEEQALVQAELAKLGRPDIVALVSLGVEKDVTIKREPRPRPQPGPSKKGLDKQGRDEGRSEPAPERAISECERSQGEILGVLGKHLAKINVCVVDEKNRDTQGLLPSTLPIDFVVRPDGKVVDFGIDHRAYKKGPLNNCMTKVFGSVSYPPAKGSNCPVTLPLKIGK